MPMRRACCRQAGRQALLARFMRCLSLSTTSQTPLERPPTQNVAEPEVFIQTAVEPASRPGTGPSTEAEGKPEHQRQLSKMRRKYKYLRFQKQAEVSRRLGATISQNAVYKPSHILENPPRPHEITLEMLLANQTHMGHTVSLWNPENSRYILGVREGIHIISLEETAHHLRRAARIVNEVAYRAGLILFVGTRPGHAHIVYKASSLAGACRLWTKWTPGSITNAAVLLRASTAKVVDEHDHTLSGFETYLAEPRPLVPDLVIILNPLENGPLLHECTLANVPTIGVIDTDADPTKVTYTIPANDDSLRSISVIATTLGRAGQDGKQRRLEDAARGIISWKTHSHIATILGIRKDMSVENAAESEKDALLQPRPLTASTRRKVEKKLASLGLKLDGTPSHGDDAPIDGAKAESRSEILGEMSVDDIAFTLKEDVIAQEKEALARGTEVEDGPSEMSTKLEFDDSDTMEREVMGNPDAVQVPADVRKAEEPASTLPGATMDGKKAVDTTSESSEGGIGTTLAGVSEAKPLIAEQVAQTHTSQTPIQNKRQETIQSISPEPRYQRRDQKNRESPISKPRVNTSPTDRVEMQMGTSGTAERGILKAVGGEAGGQSPGAVALQEVDPNLGGRAGGIQGQVAASPEEVAAAQVSGEAPRSGAPVGPGKDGISFQIMAEAAAADTVLLSQPKPEPHPQVHQESLIWEEPTNRAKVSQGQTGQTMQVLLPPIQDAAQGEMVEKRKLQTEEEPKQVAGTEELISIQTRLVGQLAHESNKQATIQEKDSTDYETRADPALSRTAKPPDGGGKGT